MRRIALCLDTESLIRPMLVGLDDVNLDELEWLLSVPDAAEARRVVSGDPEIDEAWVVSSDQMQSTNLAAALRKDDPSLRLCVIAFDDKQTMRDRCGNIGIDEIWSIEEFCSHFDMERRRRSLMSEAMSLDIDDVLGIDSTPAPRRSDDCFVMAVLSGSGGVGKSSIAAVCGMICADRGLRTAVIDADAQFGDLGRMIGAASGIALDDLIDEPGNLEDISLSAKQPFLVHSPERMEHSERVAGRLARAVVSCSERFDSVIVDMPSYWSDDHAWLLENCDRALFVMDQRSSSVRSVKRAVDLCMRMGIATGNFTYVLNRCSRDSVFSGLDVSNAIDGACVTELADGGTEIEELLSQGLAAELSSSRNGFTSAIGELLEEVLPAKTFFMKDREWEMPPQHQASSSAMRRTRFPFVAERRPRVRRKQERSMGKHGGKVKTHVAN